MLRGYALGMGAGTQLFTNLPWVLLVGPADTATFAVLMGAGWAINVGVAEWIIRRRRLSELAGSRAGRGHTGSRRAILLRTRTPRTVVGSGPA